ncbi:MAG TPA: hypothetical protein VL098_08475 [Flavipsychrobacter sp.]|nr:hypothetical protein [Flavipsychrobacter sp.]
MSTNELIKLLTERLLSVPGSRYRHVGYAVANFSDDLIAFFEFNDHGIEEIFTVEVTDREGLLHLKARVDAQSPLHNSDLLNLIDNDLQQIAPELNALQHVQKMAS